VKNILLIIGLSLLVGLGCKLGGLTENSSGQANEPSTSVVKKIEESADDAIRSVYEKIDKATMNENETELFSYASDDYTLTDEKGKVSARGVAIKDAREFFKYATEIEKSKSDVFRVEQKDGLWNASVTTETSGKMRANGKTVTFDSKTDSDEQWAKNDKGQWKCIRSITRRSTLKVNGKEVKQ
jgi:hypothetical protein